MSFILKIDSQGVCWSRTEVESKLETIGGLKEKSSAWLRWDLSVAPSNVLTRLIWTVAAKFFAWMRMAFFQVDLEKSRSILTQIDAQIPENTPLRTKFNRAILSFNRIAKSHMVNTKELDKVAAINKNPQKTMQDLGFKTIAEALQFTKVFGKELTALNLSYKKIENRHIQELIADCPNLERLFLNGAKIDHEAIRHIPKLKELKTLSFSLCSNVSDLCLREIGKLEKLERLVLYGCLQITSKGLEHLKGHQKLESLDLTNCMKMNNRAMKVLPEIPNLKSLHLISCTAITDDAVADLKRCKNLSALNLIGSKISEAGVETLLKNPELKVAHIVPKY